MLGTFQLYLLDSGQAEETVNIVFTGLSTLFVRFIADSALPNTPPPSTILSTLFVRFRRAPAGRRRPHNGSLSTLFVRFAGTWTQENRIPSLSTLFVRFKRKFQQLSGGTELALSTLFVRFRGEADTCAPGGRPFNSIC